MPAKIKDKKSLGSVPEEMAAPVIKHPHPDGSWMEWRVLPVSLWIGERRLVVGCWRAAKRAAPQPIPISITLPSRTG